MSTVPPEKKTEETQIFLESKCSQVNVVPKVCEDDQVTNIVL